MEVWRQKYRDFQRLFAHVQSLRDLNSELRNGEPSGRRLTEAELTDENGVLNERRLMVNFWKETIDLYYEFPRNVLEGNEGVVNDVRRARVGLKGGVSEALENMNFQREKGVVLEAKGNETALKMRDSRVRGSNNGLLATEKKRVSKRIQKSILAKKQGPAEEHKRGELNNRKVCKNSDFDGGSRSKQSDGQASFGRISPANRGIKEGQTEAEAQSAIVAKNYEKMILSLVLQGKLIRDNKRKKFKRLIEKIKKRKNNEQKRLRQMLYAKPLPKLRKTRICARKEPKQANLSNFAGQSCEQTLEVEGPKSELESETFLLFYSYKVLIQLTFSQIEDSLDYVVSKEKNTILKFENCLYKREITLNRESHILAFLDEFTECLEKKGRGRVKREVESTCHHCRQKVSEGEYIACSKNDRGREGKRRSENASKSRSLRRTKIRREPKVKPAASFRSLITYTKSKKCGRIFCSDCLQKHYDHISPTAHRITCPFCLNSCFCTRCQNRRSIVKLTESGLFKSQKLGLQYTDFPSLIIAYLEDKLTARTPPQDTQLLSQLRLWLQFDSHPLCSQILSLTSLIDALNATSTIAKQTVFSVVKL